MVSDYFPSLPSSFSNPSATVVAGVVVVVVVAAVVVEKRDVVGVGA